MRRKKGMLIIGDCLSSITKIEKDSIQAVITSPPYWGLRNYDDENQIGQEETPEEFVSKLVQIFGEIKRVLKDDGTVWVNIGDTYFGAKGGHWDSENSLNNLESGTQFRMHRKAPPKHKYLKTKDLAGVPCMIEMEMQKKEPYSRIRSKQHAEWASIEMLNQILNSEGIKGMIDAFEWRKQEGDNYSKVRADFFDKMIKDIDQKKVEWETKEINKEMKQRYKDEFYEKVN